MEKVFSGYALFFVLFLTGSTIGGCFPTVEELAVHGWIPPDDGATEYYVLEATMDVYGFNLEHGQQTGAANVDPESYNDSQTHFTTSWFVSFFINNTVEESKKGCLDMRCPGFQRTGGSHPFVPGQVINPVSSTSRRKQYITVRVSKDQNSGDWEIYFGFDGKAKIIGYYPRSLFTSLSNKPVNIVFGGFAFWKEHKPSPPMGSGIAPPKNAASFSNLKFFDAAGNAHPIDHDLAHVSDCYPVTDVRDGVFSYGGPGNVC
ncbi:hypothetical protein DAI22_11g078300 [Oryza sativa Japonica Group]|nr:hypothetical protein DAI22_11g078300 [Oryza sativa Japonica Group]